MQQKNDDQQVVITGLGFVLPGAESRDDVWRTLRDGVSQIDVLPAELTRDVPAGSVSRVGARVRNFDHSKHVPDLPDAFTKRYSREILMVLSAVEQARRDADLTVGDSVTEPQRVGVIGSSSRGPVEWWSQTARGGALDPENPPIDLDQAIFASLPGSPATLSAIRLGAQGTVTTLSNACVAGHQSIAFAVQALRAGQADVMILVGHETPFVPEMLRLYSSPSAGVLSRAQGDPRQTIKPYDRRRDGFAFGEGAVAMVLETRAHAERRQRQPYAAIGSAVSLNEAGHATRMDLSGRFTADLIGKAATAAGHPAADLDYICGHGTATRYNDLAESRALRLVYGGDRAGWPPLGSIKPVFGHLLGASGLLNCAAVALMVRNQCLVPTINCVEVDPECDHDHVQEGARPAVVNRALSLSFAIGSQSSAVALEKVA
ncbi:beta-ketoacyl-[acyl-carrier-protein] synthase family protein [Amycolatopsis thermoflava]|uniref:beta-ketoacyl-[acyl-carrier-protein] synthase family protein n=1 Tax=Amycolatopsis thermoflava TaxID=84480 RepID=UPI003EBF97B8